jgi:tetratricopeptide (TPR) repeat protein
MLGLPLSYHNLAAWRPVRAASILGVVFVATSARSHPEIEVAVARLNEEIATAPSNAELYIDRGELYAKHAEWVSAEANYLLAAELAPELPRLARARGALELAMRRFGEARQLLTAALARDPRDAEALVLRSRAAAAMNDVPAALADLDAALSLLPAPRPELFLERAALLPPADAVRSLDAALERVGPAISLHLRALALEESLGRIDAAAARLDSIAERSERKDGWLKRQGDLFARAGRQREARAAYVAALNAIAALPGWLRESPDTAQLAAELRELTSSNS